MKTKADDERALQVVREVVHNWDPYSLLASGCPKDEFDAEIGSLVAQIPRIHSSRDATQAVARVFSAAFGRERFSENDCVAVGATLFATLSEQGLIV